MERAMPDLKTTTEPQVNSTAPSISMKKKAPGLSFRRFFTKPGVSPYNEVERDLRAEGRRSSQRLVDDGDKYCREQISARKDRHPGAREGSAAARRPRRRNYPR